MKMLLNSDLAQHQPVPREYNLDISSGVSNHFVFSEADLPGFKAKSKARSDASNTGLPLSILRARSEKVEKPKWDRNKPYYRKAIPSRCRRRDTNICSRANVLAAYREDEDLRQDCI